MKITHDEIKMLVKALANLHDLRDANEDIELSELYGLSDDERVFYTKLKTHITETTQ